MFCRIKCVRREGVQLFKKVGVYDYKKQIGTEGYDTSKK